MKRIALLLLLLAGCAPRQPSPAAQPSPSAQLAHKYRTAPVVWTGAATRLNDQVGFAGGYGYFPDRSRGLGVTFGTIQRPGTPTAFAFALLLKAGEQPTLFMKSSSGDPTSMTGEYVFQAGERSVRIKHTVALDGQDALMIDGQEFDLAKGRAFVLDLRSVGSTPRLLKVALPAEVPPVFTETDITDRGSELLRLLD